MAISRVKTWSALEDVTAADLNAEFNNIINNLTPANVDDYSASVGQFQTTEDPGEVGTESRPTSLQGEITRLRHLLREITGEDEWYESPTSSILGLANALGSGLTANRLVSGAVISGTQQPQFLVPNGAARTATVEGATTNFIYYIEGIEYTISTNVNLTGLTAAPSSNNTCLINDTIAADQTYTKHTGEDGSEIPVDTMGTEIQSLVGQYAAFSLAGTTTEYFIAYVDSTSRLTRARRGYFFDSTDAAVPRAGYTNNDTITLLKLTWIFAKTDGTLTATYTNPVWADDEPSSPALGDYWFDFSTNKWKVYGVGSYSDADAVLIGISAQDATNTIAARSFEFFKNYDSLNGAELVYNSATTIETREAGAQVNVWGTTIKNEHNIYTWDIAIDLDSGVSEAASTTFYAYLTETGDTLLSDVKPYDRREDLQGYYHPHKSWRCLGSIFNNASQNFDSATVTSYFTSFERKAMLPSQTAATLIATASKIIPVDGSGGAFSKHLPPAALCQGQEFIIFRTDATAANAVTINAYGSETINGAETYVLYAQYESVTLLCNGTEWFIRARFFPAVNAQFIGDTPTGHGSTNTMVRTGWTARENTLAPYATYADDATNGCSFTAVVPGNYYFSYSDVDNGGAEHLALTLNGSALTTAAASLTYAQGKRANTTASNGVAGQVNLTIYLSAGDIVRPQNDAGADAVGVLAMLSAKFIGRV